MYVAKLKYMNRPAAHASHVVASTKVPEHSLLTRLILIKSSLTVCAHT